MKTIKFNKNYEKLEKATFTPIRLKDKKLKLNQIVNIKTPTKEFPAQVTQMQTTPLKKIDYLTLCHDLEVFPRYTLKNRWKPLLEAMQEIYPRITWETTIYLYTFEALPELYIDGEKIGNITAFEFVKED